MTHRVALLVGLMSATHAQAQPAAAQPVAAAEGPSERAEPAGAAAPGGAVIPDGVPVPDGASGQPDASAPDETVLQIVKPPPDFEEQRVSMKAQQFAVPLPGRRSRDPALRKARGALAGGIIFTAICGAGSVLIIVAGVLRPTGFNGSDGADYARATTGLIVCTVGSVALASYGGVRIRKIRGLAEWTGGLGLRF